MALSGIGLALSNTSAAQCAAYCQNAFEDLKREAPWDIYVALFVVMVVSGLPRVGNPTRFQCLMPHYQNIRLTRERTIGPEAVCLIHADVG